MVIEKLTPEQEKELYKYRDRYLEHFKELKCDEPKMKELCNFVYKDLLQKTVPPIFIVDSPLQAQILANTWGLMVDETQLNIEGQPKRAMTPAMRKMGFNLFYPQIDTNYLKQQSKHVVNQNMSGIEIYNELKKLYTKVSKNNFCVFTYAYIMDASDLGWIAFYHYFTDIKEVDNANFNKYRALMWDAGVYMSLLFDEVAILIKPPLEIHLNANIRLHSVVSPTTRFSDGYEQYFVDEIFFEPTDWHKFFPVREDVNAEEILSLTNTEQRVCVIKYYGLDKVIAKLKAKTIDTKKEHSDQMNTDVQCSLIEFDMEGRQFRAVQLQDHTTGKNTIEMVPREMKTYDEAMAWKFNITTEEYKKAHLIKSS